MVSQNLGCKDNTESFPATEKYRLKSTAKVQICLSHSIFDQKAYAVISYFTFRPLITTNLKQEPMTAIGRRNVVEERGNERQHVQFCL